MRAFLPSTITKKPCKKRCFVPPRAHQLLYYGTEQYLHNDTSGGTDPYNRPMMPAFSTSTTAYTLTNRLSSLRRSNPAIPYGSMTQRWINNDVYIYERKFYGNVVLVAINKNETTGYSISGLNTSLPVGTQTDNLTGLLGGVSLPRSGSGGNNPVTTFTLPAHAVSVWQFTEGARRHRLVQLATCRQPGVKTVIAGRNFGASGER